MKYRWRELEVLTMQTISNIITFIQFATMPIAFINSLDQSNKSDFKKILSEKFESIINVFLSPFDFIREYNQIISPIRASLSITIVVIIISFLYCIFFLPSWHFFIFFLDLFITYIFVFVIVLNSEEYIEKKNAIIIIIFGILYFVCRILFLFLPIIRSKSFRWHIKIARLITAIFLSRLKKDKNEEELNLYTKKIEDEIDKHDFTIQFDEKHFSYKKRIIDIIIIFIIFLIFIVFIIVGWKKILSNRFKEQQLNDIVIVCNHITYALFIGVCIRLVINIIWLIQIKYKKIFPIFSLLKDFAYSGMHFLAGVITFPEVKNMAKALPLKIFYCDKYSYYDSRSNTNTILQFFMKRNKPLCVNCSQTSANFISPCNKICFFDPSKNEYLYYRVLESSNEISLYELTDSYLTPIQMQNMFYFLFFFSLFGLIYSIIIKVISNLPAPTKNIECKYQTLINSIDSKTLSMFRSHRYKSSLYFIGFLQIKLFITGLCSGSIINNLHHFIPFIYSATSFIIAISEIFIMPHITVLHTIVNFASYNVSGIISLLIGLHVTKIIELPSFSGNIFTVIIIVTPIITTLITPFFAKKDPLLVPTEFKLLKIQKWDKKINEILKFRRERSNALTKKREEQNQNENLTDDDFDKDEILFEDEPSISFSYFHNLQSNENREHDFLVGQFDLFKLSPILVQENINCILYDKEGNVDQKYSSFKQEIKSIWSKIDVIEDDFMLATNEMLKSSKKLIECICHNNIKRLFNFAFIISSILLGWCLSSGVIRWNKINGPHASDYYLRCNMFPNGTYPLFGTY